MDISQIPEQCTRRTSPTRACSSGPRRIGRPRHMDRATVTTYTSFWPAPAERRPARRPQQQKYCNAPRPRAAFPLERRSLDIYAVRGPTISTASSDGVLHPAPASKHPQFSFPGGSRQVNS